MTPITELPSEVFALAVGCFNGDSTRAMAVLRVVYEGASQRDAIKGTKIKQYTVHRDCARFSKVAAKFLKDYPKDSHFFSRARGAVA